MGEALVPFYALKDAQIYAREHGARIIRFDDISMEMLKAR
jgi:nitrous oxide reductase accessory protein NosL